MPQSGQKLLRICKRASCLNAHSLPDISRLHCHLLRLLTRSSFSLPHIGHTNAVSKNIIASYCISHTVFMCTVDFNDWLKIKPRHERQRSWSIHSGKTLSQSKWCHLDVIWRHHKIQHQFFEQCEIRLPHVLNYRCSYDVQTAVLCNDVHMFIWFHMLFIVMFKHRTAIWAWSRQTDHPIHAVASPKSTSRAIHFFFRPSQFKFEEPLSPDAMFDLCTAFGSLSFGNVVESSWIELNRVESSWIELNDECDECDEWMMNVVEQPRSCALDPWRPARPLDSARQQSFLLQSIRRASLQCQNTTRLCLANVENGRNGLEFWHIGSRFLKNLTQVHIISWNKRCRDASVSFDRIQIPTWNAVIMSWSRLEPF